jgi:hypothetical protein
LPCLNPCPPPLTPTCWVSGPQGYRREQVVGELLDWARDGLTDRLHAVLVTDGGNVSHAHFGHVMLHTVKVQPRFDVHETNRQVRRAAVVGCRVSGVGCWVLGVGCWVLVVGVP